MPCLVDPPTVAHPHPLHIQTDWAQMDYSYGHHHQHQQQEYYPHPPPSASTIDSAGTMSSPVKPYSTHAQPGVAMPYDMPVYTSPTSPSASTSTSVSDCAPTQAHASREPSAEPSVASVSTVYAQAPE